MGFTKNAPLMTNYLSYYSSSILLKTWPIRMPLTWLGNECTLRLLNENGDFALRLGWIGVVNRSQANIDSKMKMSFARKKERDFFNSSGYA